MRVLLVNDTGDLPNPGCRATMDGLKNLLNTAGVSTIDSLKIADLPEQMSFSPPGNQDKGASLMGRIRSRLLITSTWQKPQSPSSLFVKNLQPEKWVAAVNRIKSSDHEFIRRIRRADRIVVNGEGTFHHNQLTALTILAITRVAQLFGKEVHIVNATVQDMHPEVTRMVLGEAKLVVVREPWSQRYLNNQHLPSELGADCAFAAGYEKGVPSNKIPANIDPQCACLVAGGCAIGPSLLLKMINILRKAGYSPLYYWIGDGDSLPPDRCRYHGIPVIGWDSIPWNTLPHFLKQFKLVVAGRHHMIIFALMAGVPFIPLGANTWKIEGLCELFQWPVPVFSGARGFEKALRSFSELDSEIKNAFELAAKKGREYAGRNVPESS